MKDLLTYRIIKHILWGMVVMLCLLPLAQMLYPMFTIDELDGAVHEESKADFTWKSWFDESYQQQTEKYINQNFGFRNDMVRLHHQLDYSLYNKLHAKGVLVGKKNYFYEENYLRAYKGLDFIGHDSIQKRVYKLKKIQDTLEAQGKKLIVVLAIGKGSYLPEYFPKEWDIIPNGVTNYEVYKEAFNEQGIRYIDFHQWFRDMKDTTSYPLYGKCGIHWSKYGEYLVADSILRYAQTLTDKTVAQLKLREIIVEELNSADDYDIGKGLNLMVEQINTFPMAYPKFNIDKADDYHGPKGLFVADSYYWGMFNWGMSRDIFNNGEFWFYNHMIYPNSYEKEISVGEINIKEKVEENEIIFLLSTDANLHKFAFGFIENLYATYFLSEK